MATGLDGFGLAGEFTVEDLERMPDDGRRYELLDGILLVSPAPDVWHQEVAGTLYRLLYQACPPVLAVEVLSSSTRRIDRLSKLSAYEEVGVDSYWLVDPDPQAPSLRALDLVDGRYVEVGCPSGKQAFQAQQPFAVTVVPADLVAGLSRSS